jgi:hypothetical protein
MIWLILLAVVNIALPTWYGLIRAQQKRRETYNAVFIA